MTGVPWHIRHYDSLPSTNTEAARLAAEGAAEGVCVVASEQTAGRGRLQRQWVSPKDAGLYFSVILRPKLNQNSWPLLTLTAAVAVHDALRIACRINCDIKWPNDILVNDKKLCGILAETVETANGRAVVVGIGINLRKGSFPSDLDHVATSVEDCCDQLPAKEEILAALVDALRSRFVGLNSEDGVAEILAEWSARSSFSQGKLVRVSGEQQDVIGTTDGLEVDGALRIKKSDGEIRVVRAGDVTEVRAVGQMSADLGSDDKLGLRATRNRKRPG